MAVPLAGGGCTQATDPASVNDCPWMGSAGPWVAGTAGGLLLRWRDHAYAEAVAVGWGRTRRPGGGEEGEG